MKREERIKLINDYIDTPMGTDVEVFVDEYLASKTDQETNEQPKSVSAEEILESVYREEYYDEFPNDKARDRAIALIKKCEEWPVAIEAMRRFASQHPIEQETIKPKFSAANILSWIQDGHAVPPCNQKDLLNYMISFVNHFTLVEQEKPPEAIAKEEISEQSVEEMIDLQQYVTNLLYYAHVEAMDMHSIDFDRWVESQVDNIKEFYASQKHLPTDYPKECKGCKTPINQSFYCPDCNRRWES